MQPEMSDELQIRGLTDVDRLELEDLFQERGASGTITFEEPAAPDGVASVLDPLTATIAVSGMTLTVIAIWICRRSKEEIKIHKKGRAGEEHTVTVTRSSACESEVIKQLSRLFSVPLT